MAKYILKRLGYIIIVFFLLSILLFGIFKMVPGDPARLMVEGQKQSVSPEQYEMLYQQARVRLGLDKPIPVQYLSWMGNILQGDFGYSTVYRIPVKELIGPPMKNTIALNVVYYIFLFAIGIPLGIKCAVKKDTVFDTSLQVATMIGISIPSFISALIFIYLFAIKIPIFPISGMVTTGANFTGFRAFLDYLYHMALPIIVCLTGIGGLIRYVRGALLDALSMDYVRTARAKGLKEKTVIYKHAFRNAMIPITGWIVGSIVGIFGGAVIIETLFSWKGVGKLLIDSLNQHDYTVALSMQMFYILLGLAANLMADEVAVMYCGQVVEMCKARTIFAKETTCSHPYTEGLMTSIPRLDTPVGARLEAIPGAVPHPLDLPKGCKFAPRCKYATEKCMNEEPKLELAEDNHLIRCFYPDKEARHAK